MARQHKLDIIPPLAGEKVGTPDGDGIVISTEVFWDHPQKDDLEWIRKMRAKMGKDFHRKYFRAQVELEDGSTERYECWQLDWDETRDIDKAPWR